MLENAEPVQPRWLASIDAHFDLRHCSYDSPPPPNDGEREYYRRAGTASEFAHGPTLGCSQASFLPSYHTNTNCGTSATSVVGSHAPNAWGLYDTHGNVTE